MTSELVKGWIAEGRQPPGLGRAKFKGGMTKQEMQVRLDEASKVVDPENAKLLPEEVRERTGLETNPLWHMECLVRSGILNPQQQVQALKTLAEYTHSKSPSLNQSVVAVAKAEDFLLALANEEYPTITVEENKRAERGTRPDYEKRRARYCAEKRPAHLEGLPPIIGGARPNSGPKKKKKKPEAPSDGGAD